jgi:glycosyltransferase involved in cell wall biosynthesis
VHDIFTIPADRKIIYYSGHMEERKGVAVLMHAARDLYDRHGRRDFHFLILGNREGEEQRFLDMLKDTGAWDHVTFGGYRKDFEQILPGCYLGAIASTGWARLR